MATSLGALSKVTAGYTNEYTFVRGDYQIGNDILPYYSITIPVEDAVRFLVLPRDVVLDPTQPVSLEELFQRELDAERVEKKIIPYMRQMNRVKFFNSITVTILPLDQLNPNRIADKFPETDPQAPPPPSDELELLAVGPVRIRHLSSDPKIGKISWNPNLARPVVVDGQHRLSALRELLTDPKYNDYPHRASLAKTELPVLLLVLDERAGFRPSDPIGTSVFKTMRSIFVDLNKYAVPVSPARQYLLDDRDLIAVCMRRILSENTGAGTTKSVHDRVIENSRLPLALVDWYRERAKFDTDEQITTVLVLYELVKTALQLPSLEPDNYEKVDAYLNTLNARLSLDSHDPEYYKGLIRWRNQLEENEAPFGLRDEDILHCAERFREILGPLISRLLVGLEPYANLIGEYEKAGLLGNDNENWMALDRSGKRAFAIGTDFDPQEDSTKIWEKVKADNYGFQVVFQKAFVASLVETNNIRNLLVDDWHLSPDVPNDFIDKWIARFNERIGPELGVSYCWQAAGLRSNNTIAWTQASQNSIAGFVTVALLSPLEDWSKLADDVAVQAAAKEWIRDEVWGKIRRGAAANPIEGLQSSQSRPWRAQVRRYVGDLAKANDVNLSEDELDDRALDHAAARLAKLARNLK